MTDETKPKTTRTPRTLESITKGALKLPLNDRAKLRDELNKSVETEVQALQDQAKAAAGLLG